jgi:hypothetical protein
MDGVALTGPPPPTSMHHSDNWSAATTARACLQAKEEPMSKTPNMVQKPTGPNIYAPMQLPKMVTIPSARRDPGLNARINQGVPAAPVVRTPTPTMNPTPSLTNLPGHPVK